MRKIVRFYHGLKLSGIKCPWCNVKRDCVIRREDFYWRKHLSCGHITGGTYVLPPKELERLGYVNQQTTRDPRAIAKHNAIIHDAKTAYLERRKRKWVEENLPGGRQYL